MKINEMVRFMNACDIVLDFIANFIQMTFRNVISDDLLPYIQVKTIKFRLKKGTCLIYMQFVCFCTKKTEVRYK